MRQVTQPVKPDYTSLFHGRRLLEERLDRGVNIAAWLQRQPEAPSDLESEAPDLGDPETAYLELLDVAEDILCALGLEHDFHLNIWPAHRRRRAQEIVDNNQKKAHDEDKQKNHPEPKRRNRIRRPECY